MSIGTASIAFLFFRLLGCCWRLLGGGLSSALAALDGNFGEMFGFDEIEDDEDETYNIFNDPATCVGCAE